LINPHKLRRVGSIIFSIGVGILIAAFLRGMPRVESLGTSVREGSAEVVLGPILLEPREIHFAISYVHPDIPVDIKISRLHGQTALLEFRNVRRQDLKDISWLERGLYVLKIRASGNATIQNVKFVFMLDGPPRDMLLLSPLVGFVGVLVFLLP